MFNIKLVLNVKLEQRDCTFIYRDARVGRGFARNYEYSKVFGASSSSQNIPSARTYVVSILVVATPKQREPGIASGEKLRRAESALARKHNFAPEIRYESADTYI